MMKKDMYFAVTKHWILIIPLIVIIITTSHQPEVKNPTIALLGTFEPHLEEDMSHVLDIERVTSMEEGMFMVEKSMVDAFVIKDERIIIFRNGRSMKSYYVRPRIERVLNPQEIQIEYVGIEHAKKKDIFSLFSLFVFVGFGIPGFLFQDDKQVIDALLLSPVKPRNIILSKVGVTLILLALLNFFYLVYVDAVKLNVFFTVLSIGLMYISLGTLLGIFYDHKYVSLLIYPFMLFLIIIPLFSNPLSDWIAVTIEEVLFTSGVPLGNLLVLLTICTGLLFLAFEVFDWKIKMKKVKG
jgi:hypothetical protein